VTVLGFGHYQLRLFSQGRLRQCGGGTKKMVHWRMKLPTLVVFAIAIAAVIGKADVSFGFFW
jgi:hypothetical protein